MRRPLIACRRAAQPLRETPLGHLWVPDHLLSAAVTRFFRVACPHQRRHGSNVPGPLEGRRRAAKRRMTLQANVSPQDRMPPLLLNLAALFGFHQPAEPNWRYEPPSLKPAERLDLLLDPPVPCPTSPPSASTSTCEPSVALSDRDNIPLADSSHGNATTDGQTTEHMAPPVLEHKAAEVKRELRHCFSRFVQTVGGASRRRLDRDSLKKIYQECCPTIADAGSFSLLVFRYLRNTRRPTKHILHCLSMPSVPLPHIFGPDGLAFLQMMEETILATATDRKRKLYRTKEEHYIYKRLAKQLQTCSPSSSAVQDVTVRLLIRGLWDSALPSSKVASDHDKVPSEDDLELLRGAAHKLADQSLSQSLDKFFRAPGPQPAWLRDWVISCVQAHTPMQVSLDLLDSIPTSLLNDWIVAMPVTLLRPEGPNAGSNVSQENLLYFDMWCELLYQLDRRNGVGTPTPAPLSNFAFTTFANTFWKHGFPVHAFVSSLLYAMAGHESFTGDSSKDVYGFIESYAPVLTKLEESGATLNEVLATLIADLEKRSLPNHSVIELTIPIINRHKNYYSVSDLLQRLVNNDSTLSCTLFLEDYMRTLLEQFSRENHPARLSYRLKAFEKLQSLALALRARIEDLDGQLKTLHTRRYFKHILDRANDARVVPLAYRELPADLPMNVQADLIHQFAHQYAMDQTRSNQQNWRSIRYMYEYLLLYNLEIRPLFTKALVSVLITRPLSEDQFVEQKTVIWVCRLVAIVEGEDVARQVEQDFWTRRQELILHAKKSLVKLGVYERADVVTMQKLKML